MIGQTVSHYRILAKLGQGGMGEVYLAEDTKLNRKVALKFLPGQYSADKEERLRFIHEAKAAAALNHPNIVTIYEIGEHEGQVFIAMEYVEGRTLKDMIADASVGTGRDLSLPTRQIPINDILSIVVQIAEGLAIAHAKGIVHRDVKPANVMLTEQCVAKIVDFGLAKLRGLTRLTKSGTTMGTVAYMSPEQALGKEVDQRSDIWSLGVILYEMLAGKLPFKGEYDQAMLYAVINEEPESVSKIRSDIPDELRRIVRKALEKRPEDRYQSADELLKDLKQFHRSIVAPESVPFSFRRFLLRPKFIIPTLLAICLMVPAAFFYLKHQARQRWARNEMLPRIGQMLGPILTLDLAKAYESALAVEKIIPDDPGLAAIFAKCSIHFSVKTDPPGAKVYFKYYQDPEKEWNYLGETPIEKRRVPLAFLRLKIEKPGYEPVFVAAATWRKPYITYIDQSPGDGEISLVLDKKGAIPEGMARVTGTETIRAGKLEDFYMDRYEVTNRQFREFVLKGGYQKREYWKHPFAGDRKPQTWEQAMSAFVDMTGLPGPAAWQAGDYPEGEDDFPVSGISWYEAAAYAEWAGKNLPTALHWGIAKGGFTPLIRNRIFNELIIPQSNFKGKGPERVGRNLAITSYGLFDMGGNVREWCFNETKMGRIVRGGAWDDIAYLFDFISQLSPFDRSAKNGFRCCMYIHPEKVPPAAFSQVEIKGWRDYSKLKSVADPIFQVYREQYSYDKSDLASKLEMRDDSNQGWTVEKVSFAAAYDNERIPAFLYLPKSSSPPFQTLIYFDGSTAARTRSSQSLMNPGSRQAIPPMLKGGRAVLWPVYNGTFERGSDSLAAIHDGVHTREYTDYFIKVVKDFKRSIDYLETRPDIDTQKLAYLGFSWGGNTAAIITAVEDRLKASVLNVAGFYGDPRPEVDWINYVTRIKIPTLMLNGRYDMSVPYELSAKPMYDLLGTPATIKQLILYDTDHVIPINEFIRESAKWLDKYLGPVKRKGD